MPETQQTNPAKRYERIRRQNATEVAEDYVEAIESLIKENGEAKVMALARHFGVSHVTVIRTVERLKEQKLVDTQPHKSIELTAKGEEMAQISRERHELVLQFLIAIGVSRERAEADAEGIEHHVSTETLRAMQRHLSG